MLIQEDLAAWPVALREVRRRRRAAQSRGDRAGARRPGASPSATATARPRPPRRSATRPASRSSPGRWAGRCRATGSRCSIADGARGRGRRDLPRARRRARRPDAAATRATTAAAHADARRLYHTGDVASRDADGYITYVGRADDVFKASDYRISPFELESVLIEHAAVAEAAVVPSPDPMRLAVPKAYVVLAAGPSRRSRRPRWRSSGIAARGWRRSSGSAGWSSPTCRRRSPARSAASNCARRGGQSGRRSAGCSRVLGKRLRRG